MLVSELNYLIFKKQELIFHLEEQLRLSKAIRSNNELIALLAKQSYSEMSQDTIRTLESVNKQLSIEMKFHAEMAEIFDILPCMNAGDSYGFLQNLLIISYSQITSES